ncbi:MAG TPA: helix-turn-helix transcriptional regulator [Roseiarcus sp.]|nr:helix-turn-helix transcriptional regulator [Roseiarcus sp.]
MTIASPPAAHASNGMSQEGASDRAFLNELGQRVRKMRALRGMSRRSLALASGVSERYLAQLEAGEGNLSIILLRRITRALGAAIEDLVGDEAALPDRVLLRGLLARASPQSIEIVKAVLRGEKSRHLPSARNESRVALIGLRGAGKTTLGRIAAQRLGWTFVELNHEIERLAGFSVTEIFKLYGQEGYRKLELRALQIVTERPPPLLLATAGGLVAEPLTFDLLLRGFDTIWVKAKPDEHMARVREQGDLRPMAAESDAMTELMAILAGREPYYARADAVLDTSGRTMKESADGLVRLIEDFERGIGGR